MDERRGAEFETLVMMQPTHKPKISAVKVF
jgi:hypothetical protein